MTQWNEETEEFEKDGKNHSQDKDLQTAELDPNILVTSGSSDRRKQRLFIIYSLFAIFALSLIIGGGFFIVGMFTPKESYKTEELAFNKNAVEDNTIEAQKNEIINQQNTNSSDSQIDPGAINDTPTENPDIPSPPSPPRPPEKPVPKIHNYTMIDYNNDNGSNINGLPKRFAANIGLADATRYDNSVASIDRVKPTYRLGKGKNILCTLQSKIDTSQPGMVTCVVSKDVYSDDGKMILIDKGSMVIGEQKNSLMGRDRVFVAWSQIRTPSNVNVYVDSPMADSLGAPGINGKINKQHLKKFMLGTLISIIKSGEDYAILKNSDNNEVHLDRSNLDQMIASMSDNLIKQEKLVVQPGTLVNIQLVRDLDFSRAYEKI